MYKVYNCSNDSDVSSDSFDKTILTVPENIIVLTESDIMDRQNGLYSLVVAWTARWGITLISSSATESRPRTL